MAVVQLVADGGDLTVGRRVANYVYGVLKVSLRDDEKQGPKDEKQEAAGLDFGFLYRPDDAPTGRFDFAFVRGDAQIDRQTQSSNWEQVLDSASTRAAGQVFFEREITQEGLGRWAPGVDFTTGDVVGVRLWGRVLDLPVTRCDMVSQRQGSSWKVQVGGEPIADMQALQSLNSKLESQIAKERRAAAKERKTARVDREALKKRIVTIERSLPDWEGKVTQALERAEASNRVAEQATAAALQSAERAGAAIEASERARQQAVESVKQARASAEASEAARAKADEYRRASVDSVAQARQAQQQAREALAAVSSAQADASAARKAADGYRKAAEAAAADARAAQSAAASSASAAKSATDRADALSGQIRSKLSEAGRALQKAEALTSEVKKLELATPQQRAAAIQANRDAAKALTDAAKKHQETITALERKTGELSTATRLNNDSISKLNIASGKNTDSISKLNAAQGELTKANKANGEALKKLGDATTKLTNASKANSDAITKLGNAQAAYSKALGETNAAVGKLTNATSQLSTAQSALSTAVSRNNDAVKKLGQAQEAANAARTELGKSVKALKDQVVVTEKATKEAKAANVRQDENLGYLKRANSQIFGVLPRAFGGQVQNHEANVYSQDRMVLFREYGDDIWVEVDWKIGARLLILARADNGAVDFYTWDKEYGSTKGKRFSVGSIRLFYQHVFIFYTITKAHPSLQIITE